MNDHPDDGDGDGLGGCRGFFMVLIIYVAAVFAWWLLTTQGSL